MRKEVEYETPLLQVMEIEIEQTIAGSQKIEGETGSVKETWEDETISTGDINLLII